MRARCCWPALGGTVVCPLHAVAAALAERGIASLMLGERTPFEAVASAVRRVGPSAVMVWARIPGADPDGLAGIGNQRPPAQVWTAGPGWVGSAPLAFGMWMTFAGCRGFGARLPAEVRDLSSALPAVASLRTMRVWQKRRSSNPANGPHSTVRPSDGIAPSAVPVLRLAV